MGELNIKNCTGCAACANKCPKGAIKIIQDKEDFYKPVIDETLCVNCGLCTKVCPNENFEYKNNETPDCYAIMHQDEVRLKSTSGGMFTAIAENILDKKGIVCGAAYDENWTVKHVIIDNKEDLSKLRGSKYVQSFISEVLMKNIEQELKQNRIVLFVGVPCQVAGLLNYLGKEYDNLYTIDLICAYAPSSGAFKQFLDENYSDEKILDIKFRDKKHYGWSCKGTTIMTDKEVFYSEDWMKPYLDRRFKGEHCVNCKYKRFPRPADFTIGDYWKIREFTKDCDDKKGTSGLLLNTEKAKTIFAEIKDSLKLVKPMPLHTLGWQIDVKHKIHRTKACNLFYENYDKLIYSKNIKESEKRSKVGITNWWFINNRGAILTNYALNEMVKSLGYDAYTINYITDFERDNFNNKGYVKDFSDKYIKRTRWFENKTDLRKLNEEMGTFICGSDQIFNYYPCKAHKFLYYMDWADAINNKLISYSASFGVTEFRADALQTNLVKHFLSRFDFHSIREYGGVELMKNVFGLDSEFILDPVFCVDKQKLYDIAEKATDKPNEDFIVYYWTIPERCENPDLINHVMKKTGCQKAINLFDWNVSMENWLWYMLNAKFVVTNSFHATCFSLIFNKPYLAIVLSKKRDERFKTIKKLSNMPERIFYDPNEIYNSDYLFEPVDFSYYNENIQEKIQHAYAWLENALNTPKTKKLTEEQKIYDSLWTEIVDREAQLNRQIITKNQKLALQNKNLLLLINSSEIYRKYYRYKILSKLLFGKKRKHYKEKAALLHEKVRKIRRMKKDL